MNQKLFVQFPVTHCYVAGMYESFTLVSEFFPPFFFSNINAQVFHGG